MISTPDKRLNPRKRPAIPPKETAKETGNYFPHTVKKPHHTITKEIHPSEQHFAFVTNNWPSQIFDVDIRFGRLVAQFISLRLAEFIHLKDGVVAAELTLGTNTDIGDVEPVSLDALHLDEATVLG